MFTRASVLWIGSTRRPRVSELPLGWPTRRPEQGFAEATGSNHTRAGGRARKAPVAGCEPARVGDIQEQKRQFDRGLLPGPV
jgi:hypothetical protein